MAFLAFEGIDGSGKSTLIQRLYKELKSQAIPAVITREPGGTPLSEELREILIRVEGDTPTPRTESLLYQAARAQHVDRVIRPAVESGQWVLCDRFTASTLAFQSGGRGVSESEIHWLNQYSTGGLLPDLNILLDLSPEMGRQRRMNRYSQNQDHQDRFEREEEVFHNRVRDHYLKQAQEAPNQWVVLSAEVTPEEIYQNLRSQLTEMKWLL